LQDAIYTATPDTTIRVAGGTYTPDRGTGDPEATFQLRNNVALEGGYAGCGELDPDDRNIELYETILSGDLDGDDAPVPCADDSPDCDEFGGRCTDGFCIIMQNNGENSFHVVTCIGGDATAILDGFTITAGNANGSGGARQGGGMYNHAYASSPTVNNCTFIGNTGFRGGGMYNASGSSATVSNSMFIGNAARYGGGMYNGVIDSTVTNCTFTGNSAVPGATGGGGGGGMYNLGGSPTVTNCLFSENSARGGGGMNNSVSTPTVTNCTFVANSATNRGGGVKVQTGSAPVLTNCVLWGNSHQNVTNEAAQIYIDESTVAVNYSCIQWLTGILGGIGNVGDDPLFVDQGGGTYRLSPGSPAIDAADNNAVPIGVTTDLYGNPRFVDDPATADTGNGTPPIVDMGVYEFLCGDGVVDTGEECDDGVDNSDTEPDGCRTNCRQAWCGDGVTDANEECDDGDANSDTGPDACRTTCLPPTCGDGAVDTGEECDDGLDNSDTETDACRANCTVASCGDGVVDTREKCDDGNTEPGDGCGEWCEAEVGACCRGTVCFATVEADCLDSDRVFFGYNSTCDAPDADGDGLRNDCDGCPDDRNKTEPGVCGCGWDDKADSDADGILDCQDRCLGVDDAIFAPDCMRPIPTVSTWGLVILGLLLLVGHKIHFSRRAA
jgi:cysteine-rich repeat protein